jgi:hypothetical protein
MFKLAEGHIEQINDMTAYTFGGYADLKDEISDLDIAKILLHNGFVYIIKPFDDYIDLKQHGYIAGKPYSVYNKSMELLYTSYSKQGIWGKNRKDIQALLKTSHADYIYIVFNTLLEPVYGIAWVCHRVLKSTARALIEQWENENNTYNLLGDYAELFIDPSAISNGSDITIYSLEADWNAQLDLYDVIEHTQTKKEIVSDNITFTLFPKQNTMYVLEHWTDKVNYLIAATIEGQGSSRVKSKQGINYIEMSSTALRSLNSDSNKARQSFNEVLSVSMTMQYALTNIEVNADNTCYLHIEIKNKITTPPPLILSTTVTTNYLEVYVILSVLSLSPNNFIDMQLANVNALQVTMLIQIKHLQTITNVIETINVLNSQIIYTIRNDFVDLDSLIIENIGITVIKVEVDKINLPIRFVPAFIKQINRIKVKSIPQVLETVRHITCKLRNRNYLETDLISTKLILDAVMNGIVETGTLQNSILSTDIYQLRLVSILEQSTQQIVLQFNVVTIEIVEYQIGQIVGTVSTQIDHYISSYLTMQVGELIIIVNHNIFEISIFKSGVINNSGNVVTSVTFEITVN